MLKEQSFPDGSTVAWLDRQTVRYKRHGFVVLVWIDFDEGLSIGKRVIKVESIQSWTEMPQPNCDRSISPAARDAIIRTISEFFAERRIRCRLE